MTFFEWVFQILRTYWPMLLRGAGTTIYISMIGTCVGFCIGLLSGVIRTIPVPKKGKPLLKVFLKIINLFISAYVTVFRGTPMIVHAMVIYYGVPIVFGIFLNKIFAGMFVVSINTGAYMSEIVRGGIISIDYGQFEAAQSVGMSHLQTMRLVILPQVIRNILPATGNEFVINIKDTSVLNVISVTELFFQTKSVAGNNFRYFEAFFITCIIYLILTSSITQFLRFVERKLDTPPSYELVPDDEACEGVELT